MAATWKRRSKQGFNYRFYEGRMLGVVLECAVGRGSPAAKDAVERFVERLFESDREFLACLCRVQFIQQMPWVQIELSSVPERERGVWCKQAQYNLVRVPWPEFGAPYATLRKPLQVSLDIRNDPKHLSVLWGLDQSNLDKVYVNDDWEHHYGEALA